MLTRLKITLALRKERKLLAKEKLLVGDLAKSNKVLFEIVAKGIPIGWNEKISGTVELHVRRQLKETKELEKSLNENSFSKFIQGQHYFTSEVSSQFEKHSVKKSDLSKDGVDKGRLETIETLFRSKIREILGILEKGLRRVEDQSNSFSLEEMKSFLEEEKNLFDQLSEVIEALAVEIKSSLSRFTMTRRGFFKAAVGTGAVVTDVVFDYKIGFGVVAVLKVAALQLPMREKEGFAIIIGDVAPFTSIPGLEYLFKQAYVSRMELAVGFRAKKVFMEGNIEDFNSCLEDDSIQNIGVFGHGSRASVRLTDNDLSSPMIGELWKKVIERKFKLAEYDVRGLCHAIDNYPKRGYLFKHSCGPGSKDMGGEWGIPVFPLDHIVQWKRVTGVYDLFLNPWGKGDKWVNNVGQFRAYMHRRYGV